MDGFSLKAIEAVCLGTTLTISGICYYLYKQKRKTVDKLDDAPHFTIDKNLKDILKVTPGGCLQYAVVEGAVRPVDEPLTSSFHKEIFGVLQRFKLTEHRLVWSSVSRTWMDSEQVLHQRVSTVPFVLVGSDETTVKVLCPLQASGVHMETIHEKFNLINYGFSDILLQYISGQRPKGQLETEEILRVGAALTGVGELVLEADDTLHLRPPSNGLQYFLSITDFDSLRSDQHSTAYWWRVIAIGFLLAGSAVLLWVGQRYYYHLKRLQEQEREEYERLQAENHEMLNETPLENVCVICCVQPRNCIILDCGHACCCYNCYLALPRPLCPICRQNISRVVPLYHV